MADLTIPILRACRVHENLSEFVVTRDFRFYLCSLKLQRILVQLMETLALTSLLGAGADFRHPWQRLGEWLKRVVGCLPSMRRKCWTYDPQHCRSGGGGMVAQAYNSSTQRKRQKNRKFKVSLNYIKRSRPVCSTKKKGGGGEKMEEKDSISAYLMHGEKQGVLVGNTVHRPN